MLAAVYSLLLVLFLALSSLLMMVSDVLLVLAAVSSLLPVLLLAVSSLDDSE